jgi:hypothetical protein
MALRRKQPLGLTRAAKPGIDERIDNRRSWWFAANRGESQRYPRRGVGPCLAKHGGWMHKHDLHVALLPVIRSSWHLGKSCKQFDLME